MARERNCEVRITSFNGSPKGERGNTNVMVEAFLAGAREAGAETENVFLAKKEISPCTGCNACWMKTPGICAQRDDMDELLAKVIGSDIAVFATPIYVDNVTGLMKNFLDRLIPIADPHWEKDENGECRHVMRHGKPSKIAVISNCGFPQQSHFQVLRLLFRRVARNIHADLIAEVYRDGGALLTSPMSELRPIVERYRDLVRQAGREVVEKSRLSAETVAKLEEPLLPSAGAVDDYMRMANQRFDEILSKLGK
jgi:multimeric flavodoxin WrbA